MPTRHAKIRMIVCFMIVILFAISTTILWVTAVTTGGSLVGAVAFTIALLCGFLALNASLSQYEKALKAEAPRKASRP